MPRRQILLSHDIAYYNDSKMSVIVKHTIVLCAPRKKNRHGKFCCCSQFLSPHAFTASQWVEHTSALHCQACSCDLFWPIECEWL